MGAAGLTTMLLEGPAVSPSPENSSAMVPAVISFKSANVATPPFTVTDVVPCSGYGRPRWRSTTLTTVVLSFVSMLPS